MTKPPYQSPLNPITPNLPSTLLHVNNLLLLTILLPALLILSLRIRKDYHAFLALGPGGTPSTPAGYLRICILRPLALRNPFLPPTLPPTLHPHQGLLAINSAKGNGGKSILPHRAGPRPSVAGIAPQRQLTQKSGGEMHAHLSRNMHALTQSQSTLYSATSCFEKHSTGIFYRKTSSTTTTLSTGTTTPHPAQKNLRTTCDGEVCHSHPIDGSLHLTLHPADVRAVLESGWGQRHPLAWEDGGWCGWVRSVPAGFVLVYAPRDGEELEVVMEIIRAAVWWVSGGEGGEDGCGGVLGKKMGVGV